ncbi:AI-2E family transporter [uncultured Clostridium sp.]|jgi:predicted PurR-regulated permease PerM|uniref:AI-2E family transporter n=1 Tax=uncultured Clostridium sp. TaxID=59620 RepID=UPI0026066D12|nr:AI-2E family transporter [uncultured Clostridium sp.]
MKKFFKEKKSMLIFFLVILIIIIGIYKLKIVRDIIFVLLSSFILAYALKPIYIKICNKININKRFLAFLLIISIILIFTLIFTILVPSIIKESLNLENKIANIEALIEKLISKINMPKEELYSIINYQFGEKINIMVASLTDKIFLWIIDFSENLIALAIVPIVAYYFLADGELIENKVLLFFSAEKRGLVKKISCDIDKVLGKYIMGQFMLCFLVSVLTFVSLMVVDIKFVLLLSIINGMLNIIPYFGAFLGAVPAAFIALMDDPVKVIYVLIAFIIIQQLEGNILAPKITANSIEMHPLVVIILLLIGEKIAGLLGMILIIPLGVIIKIIYEDIDYYLF